MRVCLFVSADLSAQAVLEEAFKDNVEEIQYLAYMSRGHPAGADACIKAFAMKHEIQSCPFSVCSFQQITGLGSLFDSCLVIRRQDDHALEKLAGALASVFRHVEVICYNPTVARLSRLTSAGRSVRKLSSIAEE